jgi:hypothetical protein
MALSSFDVEQFVDYRPCWDVNEVRQVVEGIHRLSNRKGKAIVQRRRCDRKYYLAPVLAMPHLDAKARQDEARMLLHVVARDLSQSGIGLLVPLFFEPEVASQLNPVVRSTSIFHSNGKIEIGLRRSSGSLLWIIGLVVRARTVQNDYLDIGIRFLGKKIQTFEFIDAS